MLLTQSTTPIIGWIATLLGYVMEFIFYCLNFIGIQNIGLCIIIFTIIVRLLMLPLTIKQQKFAKISQVMQPEINKIQRKYRNKTDQASMMKQNEEIQKVYEKYGVLFVLWQGTKALYLYAKRFRILQKSFKFSFI